MARHAEHMRRARQVLAAVALASASIASAYSPALQEATAHYRAGNWGEAFHRLAQLADAGDPDAARIALFMRRNGVAMYGRHWKVDDERLQRWERTASQPTPRERPAAPAATRTTSAR